MRQQLKWLTITSPFIFVILWIYIGVDSAQCSPQYILWKHGLWSKPDNLIHTIYLDGAADDLIIGKTKVEIETTICKLNKKAVTASQKYYDDSLQLAGRDYAWMEDTNWVVFFDMGVAVECQIFKG